MFTDLENHILDKTSTGKSIVKLVSHLVRDATAHGKLIAYNRKDQHVVLTLRTRGGRDLAQVRLHDDGRLAPPAEEYAGVAMLRAVAVMVAHRARKPLRCRRAAAGPFRRYAVANEGSFVVVPATRSNLQSALKALYVSFFDPWRDLGGDAVRDTPRAAGVYAECSLHVARNLLRDEGLTAAEMAPWCVDNDIRFPIWRSILYRMRRDVIGENEDVIVFNPRRVVLRHHLRHIRLAALVRTNHVTALIRSDEAESPPLFRHYDNDSEARLEGTFSLLSCAQLWETDCGLTAVVAVGSPLHESVMRAARRAVSV